MAADHFVGRHDVLALMRDHFPDDAPEAFGLHGIGGVGRSALIASHITSVLDEGGGRPGDVALIDIDDPTTNRRTPTTSWRGSFPRLPAKPTRPHGHT